MTNYAENLLAAATLSAFVSAADTALNGTVQYYFGVVGSDGYRKALDLYLKRHDGQACTIEEFRQCFEDATGRDLTQFARWWSQAGTPRVSVGEDWAEDRAGGRYTLTFRQHTPATPGRS